MGQSKLQRLIKTFKDNNITKTRKLEITPFQWAWIEYGEKGEVVVNDGEKTFPVAELDVKHIHSFTVMINSLGHEYREGHKLVL